MFKKILIALDRPEFENLTYIEGLELASQLNASVMLMHALFPGEGVAPMPAGEDLSFVPAMIPSEEVYRQYRQAWSEHERENLDGLKALGERALERGLTVEWSQNVGVPGRTICKLAETWGADLIAVGHRHRSALGELFMGSVSNYVLHHAQCSVLVVQES